MTSRDRMDPRLAAGLEEILADRITHDTDGAAPGSRTKRASHGRRTVWVTAVVGLVVTLLTVVTVRTVGDRQHAGLPAAPVLASTPVPAVTSTTLIGHLPKPRYGTVVHTWTDQQPGGSGPFDVTGSTVVIAAVCEGGGAITIHDASGRPHVLVCDRQVIQQPFWKSGAGPGDAAVERGPARASVTVDRGHPRFIVRMWKVDPRTLRATPQIGNSSTLVPVSLRSCAAGELGSTGTFTPIPGEHDGVVTITNRSGSACAIRSWPAMTYLDGRGRAIGPSQGGANINGRSLDSREGSVNRFQEFPPARLAPGGHGYLIAEIQPRSRLEQDDATTRAAARRATATASPDPAFPVMPPQYCDPATVSAIRLAVSGSTVTVPAPTTPTPGGCKNRGFNFGVNPVVASNPVAK